MKTMNEKILKFETEKNLEIEEKNKIKSSMEIKAGEVEQLRLSMKKQLEEKALLEKQLISLQPVTPPADSENPKRSLSHNNSEELERK